MNFEMDQFSLKTLQDHELLSRAQSLAQDERRAGIALLHHLREIERRRLYARAYGSLHEYVVRELGYSDGAAHRRISAMRLLKVVPELEEKLQTGAVSLSTASQVQNFIRAEKRITGSEASVQELRSLVAAIEGKSSRQTEAMLAARSPQVAMAIRERPRSIDGSNVQVTVVLSAELQEKLQKLRDRFAHQKLNPTLAEQLEMLADFALRKLDPKTTPNRGDSVKQVRSPDAGASAPEQSRFAQERSVRQRTLPMEISSREPAVGECSQVSAATFASRAPAVLAQSRFIPLRVRREVWRRAGGRCEQKFSNGERCARTHLLQIDHRFPRAWGGGNELKNLQLLCAVHNRVKSDLLPHETLGVVSGE